MNCEKAVHPWQWSHGPLGARQPYAYGYTVVQVDLTLRTKAYMVYMHAIGPF